MALLSTLPADCSTAGCSWCPTCGTNHPDSVPPAPTIDLGAWDINSTWFGFPPGVYHASVGGVNVCAAASCACIGADKQLHGLSATGEYTTDGGQTWNGAFVWSANDFPIPIKLPPGTTWRMYYSYSEGGVCICTSPCVSFSVPPAQCGAAVNDFSIDPSSASLNSDGSMSVFVSFMTPSDLVSYDTFKVVNSGSGYVYGQKSSGSAGSQLGFYITVPANQVGITTSVQVIRMDVACGNVPVLGTSKQITWPVLTCIQVQAFGIQQGETVIFNPDGSADVPFGIVLPTDSDFNDIYQVYNTDHPEMYVEQTGGFGNVINGVLVLPAHVPANELGTTQNVSVGRMCANGAVAANSPSVPITWPTPAQLVGTPNGPSMLSIIQQDWDAATGTVTVSVGFNSGQATDPSQISYFSRELVYADYDPTFANPPLVVNDNLQISMQAQAMVVQITGVQPGRTLYVQVQDFWRAPLSILGSLVLTIHVFAPASNLQITPVLLQTTDGDPSSVRVFIRCTWTPPIVGDGQNTVVQWVDGSFDPNFADWGKIPPYTGQVGDGPHDVSVATADLRAIPLTKIYVRVNTSLNGRWAPTPVATQNEIALPDCWQAHSLTPTKHQNADGTWDVSFTWVPGQCEEAQFIDFSQDSFRHFGCAPGSWTAGQGGCALGGGGVSAYTLSGLPANTKNFDARIATVVDGVIWSGGPGSYTTVQFCGCPWAVAWPMAQRVGAATGLAPEVIMGIWSIDSGFSSSLPSVRDCHTYVGMVPLPGFSFPLWGAGFMCFPDWETFQVVSIAFFMQSAYASARHATTWSDQVTALYNAHYDGTPGPDNAAWPGQVVNEANRVHHQLDTCCGTQSSAMPILALGVAGGLLAWLASSGGGLA